MHEHVLGEEWTPWERASDKDEKEDEEETEENTDSMP